MSPSHPPPSAAGPTQHAGRAWYAASREVFLERTAAAIAADLRHEGAGWAAYKLSGPCWQSDRALEVSKNGYRVMLTRARKGMVIFVPEGDPTREDPTREPGWYDQSWRWLLRCGARPLP